MLNSRFILRLTLFAILLAACAPATSTVAPTQPILNNPTATGQTVDSSAEATSAPTVATASPSPALPAATSRGPNLEATDPTTVNLASGGLQLVEFFEFW